MVGLREGLGEGLGVGLGAAGGVVEYLENSQVMAYQTVHVYLLI